VRWSARPHRAARLVVCCATSGKREALVFPRSRKACAFVHQHLEAIEEGRFDKLPAPLTYRPSCAPRQAHVGLDPEKVMTAYHLSGPVPIKRPLTLPADFPIVERRAPIGLAVLTVLLVVGAGYAAWHYLPREQAVVAEKVPPVPDRLLASRPATPIGDRYRNACIRTRGARANRRGACPDGFGSPQHPACPACRSVAARRDSVAPPTQAPSQAAAACAAGRRGRSRATATAGSRCRFLRRRPPAGHLDTRHRSGAGCPAAGAGRTAARHAAGNPPPSRKPWRAPRQPIRRPQTFL